MSQNGDCISASTTSEELFMDNGSSTASQTVVVQNENGGSPVSAAAVVATAAAASVVATAKTDGFLTPPVDLLKWNDMPKHLQFNRYIIEGYRPLSNIRGCVNSLFYFHNETVNILTHGKRGTLGIHCKYLH